MPFTPEQELRLRQIYREEINATLAPFVKSDRIVLSALLQILDGNDIQLGRTTGTRIGTGTDQKLGLFNVTPIVQPVRPTDAASIITAGTSLGIWA